MRFKSLGKKAIAFCLTFVVSIVLLGFTLDELPSESIKNITNLQSEQKKCIPSDKNLKYETLPSQEKSPFIPVKRDGEFQIERQENLVTPKKKHFAEKVSSEYKTLIHEENCSEY